MTQDHFVAIVIETLTHDILRYVLGAGGVYLVVNVLLKRRLAHRRIRSGRADAPQIRRELLASARTTLIFATTGITIAVTHSLGWMPIYTDINTYGWGYLLTSFAMIVVAHDAWFYWSHRLMHHRRLFRFMHRLHHRSHNPTPFTSYSFDTSEAAVNALFLPLFAAVVPMHPAALFAFVVHMMLRNAIGHCGYEIFPARRNGRPLFGWLTTVTHHDLHHADGRYNMGLYFTWWDRLMGTEHPHYLREFARSAHVVKWKPNQIAGTSLAVIVALTAFKSEAQPLSGTYAAPGLSLVVRFEPCPDQNSVCGRLLWGWNMERWKAARAGDLIVTGLEPAADTWTNGRLVDPETGMRYAGTISRSTGGGLKLKGCAGFFCRTQHWRPLGPIRTSLSSLK